jgi:hypothetical protein
MPTFSGLELFMVSTISRIMIIFNYNREIFLSFQLDNIQLVIIEKYFCEFEK